MRESADAAVGLMVVLYGEDCVDKDGIVENSADGAGTREVGIREVGAGEVGFAEVSHGEVGTVEVGLAEVETDEVGVGQFFALREGEDNFAVYVLNLDHLVLFFDAKVRIFSDSGKYFFQVAGG